MNLDDMFSDIPGLADTNGFAQFVENQNASQQPATGNVPPLTQPNPVATPNPTTPEQGTGTPAPDTGTNQPVTYTAEQVQQLINSMRAQQTQVRQPQVSTPQPSKGVYTPQEINAINTLLARGYSLEQVMQAVNANRAKTAPQADPAVLAKINRIEQYLADQQYKAEQNAFVDKMNTFGTKFGLSEDDLVTFGNAAMSKGINLLNVSDVEMVFKALYPEQYAVRVQRMSNTPTSQIYGGQSVPEAPRAAISKAEDAYVENFLQHAMPNQYGMQRK